MRRVRKRVLSFIMALTLVLGLMPGTHLTVLADGEGSPVTVSNVVPEFGAVTIEPEEGNVAVGETVTVTTAPNNGYRLSEGYPIAFVGGNAYELYSYDQIKAIVEEGYSNDASYYNCALFMDKESGTTKVATYEYFDGGWRFNNGMTGNDFYCLYRMLSLGAYESEEEVSSKKWILSNGLANVNSHVFIEATPYLVEIAQSNADTAKYTFVMPNEPVIVQVKYEPIVAAKLTVSFDENGGSSVDDQVVDEGSAASRPADPEREGYRFSGWYQGENLFDFSTTITENVTLTAHWDQAISRTVTFKVVNGYWDEWEEEPTAEDVVVTLNGYEGDELKLSEEQIPAVGNTPEDAFAFGDWDAEPDTETAITEDTVYTYTYEPIVSAVIIQAPEAKELVYDGSSMELVTEGIAEGGDMAYALGDETEATEAFTTMIPVGVNAGTYYVWYMVLGDEGHFDVLPEKITVEIQKGEGEPGHAASVAAVTNDSAYVSCFDLMRLKLFTKQEYVLAVKGEEPDWSTARSLRNGYIRYRDLLPGTEYCIYARAKETENTKAGEAVVTNFVTSLDEFYLTGDACVGGTVKIATTPENAEGLSWQWFHARKNLLGRTIKGEAIEGATSDSYTFTEEDLGKRFWYEIYKGGKKLGDGKVGPIKSCPIFTQEMFRLYNPNSGEHFYTASVQERDDLTALGWNYEGVAWIAPEISGVPVYRLYNPNAGDHHYTPSEDERDELVNAGWNYEGIGWYSDENLGVPVHRLYNPNATGAGAHHYTTSDEECQNLIDVGWNYEGIGWHGVK